MYSFQDFQKTVENNGLKNKMILDIIREYTNSAVFNDALIAQKYYERRNDTILRKLSYMQTMGIADSNMIFHKLCSGFFPKFVRQLSQYLLGNGVTLDESIKKLLGPRFDKSIQQMGIQTLVDSVNYGFWNVDRLIVFRATEFCPLFDEITGDMMAGIRFWQLDSEKPMYIELYEGDGVTRYKNVDGTITEDSAKRAYRINEIVYEHDESEVIDTESYSRIPIFPMYANETHTSELTAGLRGMIDAYDAINSDLSDSITNIEGIYWVLKNFGGDNAYDLIQEIQQLRVAYQENENDGADSKIIEVPYLAKQTALDILRKQMYTDFMALDMETITTGNQTATAVKIAETDIGLKADIFEWQVTDFVQNILELLGYPDETPQFKRRTITNDTETIANISTMLTDGYVDVEWCVNNSPLIADEDRKALLDRLELAEQERIERETELQEQFASNNDEDGTDDDNEVTNDAGQNT